MFLRKFSCTTMSQCCIQMKNPCPLPNSIHFYQLNNVEWRSWFFYTASLLVKRGHFSQRECPWGSHNVFKLPQRIVWAQWDELRKKNETLGCGQKTHSVPQRSTLFWEGWGHISLVKYLCGKGQNSQPFLSRIICLFLAGPSENRASWFQDFVKNLANLSKQTWWWKKVIFGY